MIKKIYNVIAFVVSIGCISQLYSAEVGRVFQSVVFPGMGQLADNQKVWGLGFMGCEAIALSLFIDQVSHSASSARETEILQTRYNTAQTYEDKVKQYSDWNDAFDKSSKAKTNGVILGSVAGGIWALNIFHAILFPPAEAPSEDESMLNKVNKGLSFKGDLKSVSVAYTINF